MLFNRDAPPPPPSVSGASVTRIQNGSCTAPVQTTINRITWSLSNADNALYKINVVSTGSVGTTINDVGMITTIDDDTGNDSKIGSGTAQTSAYTVEVRRRSDNALISSSASNTLNFNTNRIGCLA